MMFSSLALRFLAVSSITLAGFAQVISPPDDLKQPTAERLNVELDFDLDEETCNYSLTISFAHDPTLPLPPGPQVCNPADIQIAPDGLPWLAFREHYMLLPRDVRYHTPFNHLSIDFQSCGHPPLDVFTKPHYDFHIYTTNVAEREKRPCLLAPMAPICAFPADAQPTEAGKEFFDDFPTNVVGFGVGPDTAIPFSGIHSWDFFSQPLTAADWTEPVFVTGGYGGKLVFWEPMLPIEMVTGPDDRKFEETLVWDGDVDPSIPTFYSVDYEAATGRTTVFVSMAEARNCRIDSGDDDDDDDDDDRGKKGGGGGFGKKGGGAGSGGGGKRGGRRRRNPIFSLWN